MAPSVCGSRYPVLPSQSFESGEMVVRAFLYIAVRYMMSLQGLVV